MSKAIILQTVPKSHTTSSLATAGTSYRDTSDPESKVWRRLLPEELEELNGFPARLDADGA